MNNILKMLTVHIPQISFILEISAKLINELYDVISNNIALVISSKVNG